MLFQIRHEEFGEFSPNHSTTQVWAKKLQSTHLSWHWTVMQNLNKAWSWGFQKWDEEFGELSLEHSKPEKLYIDRLFLSKAYNVSVRKFQRNYVSWHSRVMQKFKGKLTCCLKNDIRNLVNFHSSSRKSENLLLVGSFCPKHI